MDAPFKAPEFVADAAVWSAKFLLYATQLIVLRNEEKSSIDNLLTPFPSNITPEVVFSADLCLKYLADTIHLAKGLAPADYLVEKLYTTARHWPFSSAAMQLENVVNEEILFKDPSLKLAYLDKIILAKNKTRFGNKFVSNGILEVLGNHSTLIWPEFSNSII